MLIIIRHLPQTTQCPIHMYTVSPPTCDYILYNNLNNKCPITIFLPVSSQSICRWMNEMNEWKDGFISHLTYLVQLPYLGKSQSTKMTNFANPMHHVVLWINYVTQYFICTYVLSIKVYVRQAHNNGSKCGSIDTLVKKIRRTGTIDRQPGSVRVNENIENGEDPVLSQKAPIDSDLRWNWLTVHRIIHRDLQLICVSNDVVHRHSGTPRRSRHHPAAAVGDTGFHRSWPLAAKQSRSEPRRLQDLGSRAEACKCRVNKTVDRVIGKFW